MWSCRLGRARPPAAAWITARRAVADGPPDPTAASIETADDGDAAAARLRLLLRRQGDRRRRRHLGRSLPRAEDHGDASVLLFPGEGSQFVGMGAGLLGVPNVSDMYARASQTLGFDLLKACVQGPAGALDAPAVCQPALLVTSMAAVERLYHERPSAVERCVAAAGMGAGELAALVFSGAISFDDGVLLAKVRAEAMQYCSEQESGGMAAVFHGAGGKPGLACTAARRWALERRGVVRPVCQVTAHLYAGAKIIAGHKEALNFVESNAAEFGLRAVKRLPPRAAPGAFHTPLMGAAAVALRDAVARTALSNPRVPVHSCVDGRVYRTALDVRQVLPKQVATPLRWEQAMHAVFKYDRDESVPRAFECGPGAALTGMLAHLNGKVAKRAVRVPV